MSISSQAMRRRAKNYLRRHQLQLYVPTLPGLEHVTARELDGYAQDIIAGHGGVTFEGDLSTIYQANLSLRTGSRVLLRLGNFLSQTYPMLYDRARSIDWVAILGNCPDIGIHVSSRESRLRHKRHVQDVIYDAICSRLEGHSIRPRLRAEGLLTIHARLHRDRCTLSLDTTGRHLHMRGYRTYASTAPIRETTAAAMLLMADVMDYDVIVDPFCGAGTFLIEAELIARNFPPGAWKPLAIEASPLHAPGTFRHTRKVLLERASALTNKRILGFDISREAVFAAERNASQAEARSVTVTPGDALDIDYQQLRAPSSRAIVIANPPYGKRLGNLGDARALLDKFCSVLDKRAGGWAFVIVAPHGMQIRHPGLETKKLVTFMNGGLKTVATFGYVGKS